MNGIWIPAGQNSVNYSGENSFIVCIYSSIYANSQDSTKVGSNAERTDNPEQTDLHRPGRKQALRKERAGYRSGRTVLCS